MRKRLFILSMICFLITGFEILGFTADGDITKVEVKPNTTRLY